MKNNAKRTAGAKRTTAKSQTTTRPTISNSRLYKFVRTFRRIRRNAVGVILKDPERDHWEIEENDDFSGEYFVNYWAPSARTAATFKRQLAAAAKETDLEFDALSKFADLDPETDGDHIGRVLTCYSIAAKGTRAYWRNEYKRLNAGK